jgi:CheY-like chemotaxis protein
MKIIVADDFLSNRLLISEVLHDLGHDCVDAENGQQVIDILQNRDDIDLILMDIEMPLMSGLEALKCIREDLHEPKCDIPIIAITAHSSFLQTDSDVLTGFNQMLTKPYSIGKMAELLRQFTRT